MMDIKRTTPFVRDRTSNFFEIKLKINQSIDHS